MLQAIFFTLVVAACVVIYWMLIRPKLHAIAALDPYFDAADERYARWFARLHGWRVEAFSFIGILLLELPDIIDLIMGANVIAFMPSEWQKSAQLALLLLALVRAFLTNRKAQEKLDVEKKEGQ